MYLFKILFSGLVISHKRNDLALFFHYILVVLTNYFCAFNCFLIFMFTFFFQIPAVILQIPLEESIQIPYTLYGSM